MDLCCCMKAFSSCREGLLLSSRGTRVLGHMDLGSYGAQTQSLWLMGLVAPQHVESSQRACSFTQQCPTVHYPITCSLPGSFVHGIALARRLEWVAISSSSESFQPEDWTCVPHIRRQTPTPGPLGKFHETCFKPVAFTNWSFSICRIIIIFCIVSLRNKKLLSLEMPSIIYWSLFNEAVWSNIHSEHKWEERNISRRYVCSWIWTVLPVFTGLHLYGCFL